MRVSSPVRESWRGVRVGLLACVLLLVTSTVGHAQGKKDDAGREQLRRAQQALRKAEAERADALREKQALMEKAEALGRAAQHDRDAAGRLAQGIRREAQRANELETVLKSTRADLDALRKDKGELEAGLARARDEVAELARRLKEQMTSLESREDQAKRLLGRVATQEKRLAACEVANARMHETGLQCLTRFEQEVLPRTEPFTQLKRVELENALEQYRDRLDEQRLNRAPRQ